MNLLSLIKFERPVYIHWAYPDYPYALKRILRLAKEQGVLPEICQRLGISLRSTQRWIPTPLIEEKVRKKLPKRNFIPLLPDPIEYEIKKRKRKNRKKKSLNLNKSIERLLQLVFFNDLPIPDREPTNEEIMKLLLNHKKSVGTWQKVSQELGIKEMVLYRFRKTGEMKKCNRILLYMLLVNQPEETPSI